MATLSRDLRKILERSVLAAREIAQKGAAEAVESFGIRDAKVPGHLDEPGRLLRRKLRAHGRQVGDTLLPNDEQETAHLVHEAAYEHWHRMLFARFLAENDLLRHPDHGVPLSLSECQDLAREQSIDVWELAGQFAQKMLPEIFRPDDPVLSLRLPAEARNKLLIILNDMPRDIFLADDSLGWVYQFWQAKRKEEVNASGVKIGADEIAPVTQLFTEDYMVEFLLHNTLGAWWVAKRLLEGKIDKKLWKGCQTEEDCRRLAKIGSVEFKYLRFIKKDDGQWFPAAGGFEGWPRLAKDLKVLDPCMGSGHFLVFALPILMAFRREEDNLSYQQACVAALQDNIYGLEIDPRCAQIAAFNLAFTAWKLSEYQPLPSFNLACSGGAPNTGRDAWLKLAGGDENLKFSMGRLYELFQKAPYLGSLINPRTDKTITFSTPYQELLPYLERVSALESDEVGHELAISAKGVAQAAQILANQFTLIITNVPYLGRPLQSELIKDYCEQLHPIARSDLATCFIERSLSFCEKGASIALVTPQSWLFQPGYKGLRRNLLINEQWDCLVRLGARAFETIGGEQVNICLLILSNTKTNSTHEFAGIDVTELSNLLKKKEEIQKGKFINVAQAKLLKNPDIRITLETLENDQLLEKHAVSVQGLATGDDPQFTCYFWELPCLKNGWEGLMGTVERTCFSGGRERLLHWENGSGRYYRHAQALKAEKRLGGWKSGTEARGKIGILVSQMSTMPVTLYTGEFYDHNASVIITDSEKLAAVWLFTSSPDFFREVRKLDHSLKPSNNVLIKVPFDFDYWQKVAEEKYPKGLPKAVSTDPSQWIFNGYPTGSDNPLQTAIARLVGYRWPRQTGSNFTECPALGADGLESLVDRGGIVSLVSLRGEPAAADRLRSLLAASYGREWAPIKEKELIATTGAIATNFDDWLRDDFFAQHCILFHHRPFVWHIWDGRRDGFHALVNYHCLAEGNGAGRRTLEALLYSYLGEWIVRQRDAVKRNEAGADGRLAAALELQEELKKILAGEPPYDIFVRWKPLSKQAIGWEPDINDGVRVNIRPFMMANLSKGKKGAGILHDKPNIKWEKDRGKEPVRDKKDYPWFWGCEDVSVDFLGGSDFDGNRWNSCHYSNGVKRKARG